MNKIVYITDVVSALTGEAAIDTYFVRITEDSRLEVVDKDEKVVASATHRDDTSFVDAKGVVVEVGLHSMALDRFKIPEKDVAEKPKKTKEVKQAGGSPIGHQTRSMSSI
jgi:hypothetical protein